MPAISKTDPLLVKPEPGGDGGSASGITYLRRGKKPAAQQCNSVLRRGVRIWQRNNSTDTKVSEEGGGGGVADIRAEIPLHPWSRPWWGRLSPCSPWRSMVDQIFTCSPGRSTSRYPPAAQGGAGGCLKEAMTLWRAQAGAGLLAGLVTPWGTHTGAGAECEQSSLRGGRSSRDNVWWTDCSPHCPSACATSREEVEKNQK